MRIGRRRNGNGLEQGQIWVPTEQVIFARFMRYCHTISYCPRIQLSRVCLGGIQTKWPTLASSLGAWKDPSWDWWQRSGSVLREGSEAIGAREDKSTSRNMKQDGLGCDLDAQTVRAVQS